MFKTFIIWICVLLGTLANAHQFPSDHNDVFKQSLSSQSEDEISQVSIVPNAFFDAPTSDYRVLNLLSEEPGPPNKKLVKIYGVSHRSLQVFKVQFAQYLKSGWHGFKILRVKKTLYPFHTFW
ncbi:hypothetical protein [Winogradskyella rapida]|uniref:Uncharacterized protein n=1 Tax=Winogradskyella rapida TaxID=549701 RepID=A0ABW3KS93_9FLAO